MKAASIYPRKSVDVHNYCDVVVVIRPPEIKSRWDLSFFKMLFMVVEKDDRKKQELKMYFTTENEQKVNCSILFLYVHLHDKITQLLVRMKAGR